MDNSNSDWDVEKYKQDHEIDEHWELKKSFLIAHKDRFPEDELVCLAQVFVNVELLGCRYPEETMKLVAELSQSVAQEFRDKRKTKLKRTFVQASDAASSKVKGLKNTPNTSMNESQSSSIQEVSFERSNENIPEITIGDDSDVEEIPRKKAKTDSDQPYGKIILFDYPGDAPQSVLTRAANAYGVNLEWKTTPECKTAIYMNNKLVAQSNLPNKKQARTEAATFAVQKLKKYYYTIKVNHTFDRNASQVSCNTLRNTPEQQNITENNIGNKLMKLMGWTGGGLGKTEQGIVEPVSVEHQLSRKGLGLHTKNSNMAELKKKCRELVRNFVNNRSQQDLVFSSEFTKEERAIMHQIAKQMGVKSHSYGPENNRTLIFSRKIDPDELIAELKSIGGRTEKYELIEPSE